MGISAKLIDTQIIKKKRPQQSKFGRLSNGSDSDSDPDQDPYQDPDQDPDPEFGPKLSSIQV